MSRKGEAFGDLDARAARVAGHLRPPDRISLRDHIREAEVGAFGAERGQRQRLRFAIVAEVVGRAHNDDVDSILSYDRLVEAVEDALSGGRADLLETLAERVAAGVLRAPQTLRAFVRVEKLDRGPGALGVEVVRARDGQAGASAPPRPRVTFLGQAALADPGLPAALERLAREPLILCVGDPGLPRPATAVPSHSARVTWLAVDQAAWALASLRRPRLHVVSTRTEIDWALRRGVPGVWAPSRLASDDPDGPDSASDARLAAWLAQRVDASELRVIGAEVPPGADGVAATVAEPLA